MEQIVNFANQLITAIVNWSLFLLIYGVVFYCIGVVLFRIFRAVYDRFSPFWKKLFRVHGGRKL